jgi:hypothetical protein
MYARARESPRREQSLGDFLVRRTSRSRRARLAEGQQRSNPRWCRQGLVHGWAMAAAKTSRSAREAQPGRNDVMVSIASAEEGPPVDAEDASARWSRA